MKTTFLAALLACPLVAQACSFAPGYERFTPAVATFEPKTDDGRFAPLPAPRINVVEVRRGKSAAGASCDDIGWLSIDLDWPASSAYRLSEVGFYFRIVGGDPPERLFPLVPITGKIGGKISGKIGGKISGNSAGQRARFFFIWVDGAPSSQAPLKLEAEVFAVNNGLEIGAPRRFRISSGRGR